jgi:hypothetical protein
MVGRSKEKRRIYDRENVVSWWKNEYTKKSRARVSGKVE